MPPGQPYIHPGSPGAFKLQLAGHCESGDAWKDGMQRFKPLGALDRSEAHDIVYRYIAERLCLPDGRTNRLKGGNDMAREPWVDQDECISCGLCIDNVPTVFRFADNGKSECYDPKGAPENEIQTNAIDACPMSCIHWRE